MSWVATTKGTDSDLVEDLMVQTVEYRFGEGVATARDVEWLSDNGSCHTAADLLKFARRLGHTSVATPVVSPHSNGRAESFVKTFKQHYAKPVNMPDSEPVMERLDV